MSPMDRMDRNDELILAAAAMFHAAAMQQMGKLVNPLTNKAEVDLAQARFSIDLLAALLAKTQGHLHADAVRELEALVFQLRMNYLDEARKSQRPPDEGAPVESAHAEGAPADHAQATAAQAERVQAEGARAAHDPTPGSQTQAGSAEATTAEGGRTQNTPGSEPSSS
jgi:hypothetical protein